MVKLIGAIGDSITHGYYDSEDLGWFARLGKLILQDYPSAYLFNNLAQAGDNIADASMRAVHEVLSRHFDLLLVSLGTNDLRRRKDSDLALDFSFGAREMYWNNLLDTLQKSGAQIVVFDLLPVVEKRYLPTAALVRRNEDVERYNNQICRICHERKIKFFARYPQWHTRTLEKLYHDATHPNARGHQILAEEVFDYLKKEKLLDESVGAQND